MLIMCAVMEVIN